MSAGKPWLEKLTLAKLHRLAVLVGAPCSGTKAVVTAGIRDAVSKTALNAEPSTGLSLLSIDMGIRNLAFTHFTASITPKKGRLGYEQYGKPRLEAWHRQSVSQPPKSLPRGELDEDASRGEQADLDLLPDPVARVSKESFEPVDYARHAYSLINHMLSRYKPNQILIERQRFRSGGQSAVQEWTIRVGVFEGMLYAVLRTLIEQQKLDIQVDPMQPARVNRTWLHDLETVTASSGKRLSGRDVKKAKIGLVGEMLETHGPASRFTINEKLTPLTESFVSVWKRDTKSRKSSADGIGKLDDLADSLLQGLVWIDWQNNRLRLNSLGQDAFDLDTT